MKHSATIKKDDMWDVRNRLFDFDDKARIVIKVGEKEAHVRMESDKLNKDNIDFILFGDRRNLE